jgi:hypothetical protein
MGIFGDGFDFVIPLCNYNIIIRVTLESIIVNYKPKNIYVITNKEDSEILEKECLKWNTYNTKINLIDEETFFIINYGLTKSDIYQWYTWKDDQSREYGWWFQQLIKLAAYKQIKNLSDPYVVWDADLIILQKWEIYEKSSNMYKFAILQECAKNEFNKNEYSKSIYELIGLHAIEPPIEGTFVPHHFIMHHKVLEDLISHIEYKNKIGFHWIKAIMSLSKTYYRFSEYKCIATFMNSYHPGLLAFYPFYEYGKSGIRYRDSNEIIEKLKNFCENNGNRKNLTYPTFMEFINENFHAKPTYIQLEHVVHTFTHLENVVPNN